MDKVYMKDGKILVFRETHRNEDTGTVVLELVIEQGFKSRDKAERAVKNNDDLPDGQYFYFRFSGASDITTTVSRVARRVDIGAAQKG